MNKILLFLVSELSSIICLIGAIYLMGQGKSGWGWLLLFAILTSVVDFPDKT